MEKLYKFCFSVATLCLILLQPQGLQQTRLPCPSLSHGVCSNSCSLSRWCHPSISSLVVPLSSCPQSFPASGSFPMSWFFASGGIFYLCSSPLSHPVGKWRGGTSPRVVLRPSASELPGTFVKNWDVQVSSWSKRKQNLKHGYLRLSWGWMSDSEKYGLLPSPAACTLGSCPSLRWTGQALLSFLLWAAGGCVSFWEWRKLC